jgi:hypothetical protein
MAGFGSLGGLGGRPGGFGVSYPTRVGAPNSQTIENPLAGMPSYDDWRNDFDTRLSRTPQTISGTNKWIDWQDITALEGPRVGEAGYNANAAGTLDAWLSAVRGADHFKTEGTDHLGAHQTSWVGRERSQDYTMANPAYTALMDEKNRLQPAYDNSARQEQAYSIMNGGNQINGLMGPDYTNRNFGRIVGAETTNPVPAGDDMAWADGLYNPTGTYATTPGKNTAWSLW